MTHLGHSGVRSANQLEWKSSDSGTPLLELALARDCVFDHTFGELVVKLDPGSETLRNLGEHGHRPDCTRQDRRTGSIGEACLRVQALGEDDEPNSEADEGVGPKEDAELRLKHGAEASKLEQPYTAKRELQEIRVFVNPGSVARALRSSPLSSGSTGYRAVPRLASSSR